MKLFTLLVVLFFVSDRIFSQIPALKLSSPDGKIGLQVKLLHDGAPVYSIDFNGNQILGESSLGIKLTDIDFTKGLEVDSVSELRSVSDKYQLISGKRQDCSYKGNERTIRFLNSKRQSIEIIFRLSDDGVAFRYFLPEKSEEVKKIVEESTSFRLTPGTKIYMSPCPDVYIWDGAIPSHPTKITIFRVRISVNRHPILRDGYSRHFLKKIIHG